jgi:adenylate cyclase
VKYLFDHGGNRERERLATMERGGDPGTIQCLESLGIAEGWSCLEVGAGLGSIAEWLCRRVGPSGRVVATDLETKYLEAIEAPNLEVRQHDITADELEESTFDLVHARKVLEHMRNPDPALERMAAALRPGGWLVVEDGDLASLTPHVSGIDDAWFRRGYSKFIEAMSTAGFNPTLGIHLGDKLRALGLAEVGLRGSGWEPGAPLGGGGRPLPDEHPLSRVPSHHRNPLHRVGEEAGLAHSTPVDRILYYGAESGDPPQGERMSTGDVDRKLAAILSADVVGYSRLMADDEAATIRTLSGYREAIAMLVRQHRGRVVDFPGDNILTEFPTALDAVRCALEIQGVLRARNANLPAERRMEFRIGVHMGDIAVEGGRVYGDGVNIAARLEALAEAGGVCISATVHEQVRNKVVDVGYADLGDQTVKNIPDQVHVYRIQPRAPGLDVTTEPASQPKRPRRVRTALTAAAAIALLAGVALWATWPRPLGLVLELASVGPPVDPALPDNPSIVVLPFVNMSGDPGQEHFSDGITEELTARLAGSPFLFVISRNSAFSYKGKAVKVDEVGRELGVRYVVEGSHRRAGDRVRITAQLIDATTGHHLWSQQYDREMKDIFDVQSDISEAILGAVGAEVNEAELARIRRRPTDDLTAYEAYTQALSTFRRMTRADLAEARRLLERAIEADPDYAAPVSLLSSTYFMEYNLGWTAEPPKLDRGEELANRALKLDPSFPGGHIALAGLNLTRRRPERAIAHAEKAIELAPSFAVPHMFLGAGLAQSGRPVAAIQSLKRATRLDPRVGGLVGSFLAGLYAQTGRTEEAIELWERARAEYPELILPRVELADRYAGAGRMDEARVVVEEIRNVTPELTAAGAAELARRSSGADADQVTALAANLRQAGLP